MEKIGQEINYNLSVVVGTSAVDGSGACLADTLIRLGLPTVSFLESGGSLALEAVDVCLSCPQSLDRCRGRLSRCDTCFGCFCEVASELKWSLINSKDNFCPGCRLDVGSNWSKMKESMVSYEQLLPSRSTPDISVPKNCLVCTQREKCKSCTSRPVRVPALILRHVTVPDKECVRGGSVIHGYSDEEWRRSCSGYKAALVSRQCVFAEFENYLFPVPRGIKLVSLQVCVLQAQGIMKFVRWRVDNPAMIPPWVKVEWNVGSG